MFLTDLSIKRPVVASVMSLVLVIFGLVTFQEIPTDELPDVQPPVVTIQTELDENSSNTIRLIRKEFASLIVGEVKKLLSQNGTQSSIISLSSEGIGGYG